MKTDIYVPNSNREAGIALRRAFRCPLESHSKREFLRAWCAVAYLFPGLHPDGFEEPDSGWPRVLRRIAAEAWRRAAASELADEELYPCDAQWSGLYDAMQEHLPEESERRRELAAAFGQ